MKLKVKRNNIEFKPDFHKVIARFYMNGDDRAQSIIDRVRNMPEGEVNLLLGKILREFSQRHRNISRIFENHFEKIAHLAGDTEQLSSEKKMLIGSYFTMEYSIESAALFNPSIIEDPDQTGLSAGQKRFIVSFRATGEGHISSIVFRRGVVDENNEFYFDAPGSLFDQAEVVKRYRYEKNAFTRKLVEMGIPGYVYEPVIDKLGEEFLYNDIRTIVENEIQNQEAHIELKNEIQKILWLADSHYEIKFSLDTDISERVIFPVSNSEHKGIEDARFVRFVEEDGKVVYYATYTAFNGMTIMPKLIKTENFYDFEIKPLHGQYAMNKNMALFPRKINGKYAMISRIDGVNNYIMFSENINVWEKGQLLQEPLNPWEFVQIGNGGSPIETPYGWLLVTHGVGPLRHYCLGASLLDLEDPTREVARLKEPMLVPDEREREGYVPNVVYTCGCTVHNGELIIPYAMSDYSSTFATINLEELMGSLMENKR